MKVFGKTLGEYLSFQKYPLLFVAAIGLARLGLSLAGAPNSATKWLSIDVATLLVLVYYSVTIHTSGFGSYRHLLPVHFIQSVTAQSIIIFGIVLAILTNKDNIFSAPEFSGGRDGKSGLHVLGHVIVAVIFGPLVGWLLGSALLFVVKRVAPGPNARASRAAA
jgi:hypothetical protein